MSVSFTNLGLRIVGGQSKYALTFVVLLFDALSRLFKFVVVFT